MGSFVQCYGSEALDASTLLMVLTKFSGSCKPRMRLTLDRVLRELTSDSHVYRYHPALAADDGFGSQEGTFNMCSFWPVEALARAGRLEEARLMSLDPYMRGRMNAGKSYAAPAELGQVMPGGTVGIIAESKNPALHVDEAVLGSFGWQHYGISSGQGLQKLPKNGSIPLSAYLGGVGMPGVTAWIGLTQIGHPKSGETVVVSAASGAVGSMVGQLAKSRGCRAVGIAGGQVKCDYVVQEPGFDACVDYKA